MRRTGPPYSAPFDLEGFSSVLTADAGRGHRNISAVNLSIMVLTSYGLYAIL